MIKLKIKKLNDKAVIPTYATKGDACFDLTATSIHHEDDKYIEYGTGLAMEIPEGYVGLIFPRSSVTKKALMLKNSVGVIDSGYRGEIKFRFQETQDWGDIYDIGDRVGQMMIIERPEVVLMEMDELSDSERGEGGYGSTGD